MAKAKGSTPPNMDELLPLLDALHKESDRGFALVVSAWIDDALQEVLRSRFIMDGAGVEELLGTDSPLGTFSAKIKAAYCMGLIDARVRRELDLIRKIRNDFAHARSDLSFTTPQVKSRCEAFGLLAEVPGTRPAPNDSTPRNNFMLVTVHLLLHFIEMARTAVRPNTDPAKELDCFFAKRRAMETTVQRLIAFAKKEVEKKKKSQSGAEE